jgi:type I restriction enzyme, S subunit
MQLLQHFKELTVHPKNAKELKGLILQLAIQGKLTAQWRKDNPDTEPASVLLEKITSEKRTLIKDKKIKKDKVFPDISESDLLFELPKNWHWCRLQDYLDVRDGTHDSPIYVDDGIPLVTSKNLYTKKLDLTKIKFISESDHAEISKRSKVDKDDILFAMIGSIGNPVIVDIDPNFSIKNVALIKYYLRDLCVPHFILNFLEYATKQFKDDADGAVQSFVSLTKLRAKEFPLPPLEEQKAIVATVNQLFVEVEQLEDLTKKRIELKEDFVTSALRQLSTQDTTSAWAFLQPHFKTFFTEKSSVKKLRESILQLAVQGKLTKHWRTENPNTEDASVLLERIKAEKALRQAQGKIKKEKPLPAITEEEIPYKLPEGWVWCRFRDVMIAIKGGGTPSKSNHSYWDGSLPWASVKDLKDFRYLTKTRDSISELGLKNSSANLIPKGRLIICTRMGLGKIAINKIETTINQDLKAVELSENVDIEFIYDYYKTLSIMGSGMTVAGIKQEELLSYLVALPPIEEQKAIVQKVNTLMALCDTLEKEIETHQTTQEHWMQSCLKEVFEN